MEGGYLIRMLEKAVGEDVFTKGINRYLTKYSYGNAGAQELWEALQIEANLANSEISDIDEIMNTFANQVGFPTVHVEFVGDGRIRLTQSRFLRDSKEEDPGKYKSEYGYRWSIPFTFTSSQERDFDRTSEVVVMDYTVDATLLQSDRIPSPTEDNWVIGNLQVMGYYQVNYDRRNWEAICKQLKTDHTVIPVLNRYQIIHDVWNLAETGNLDMDIAVRCTEYIVHERGEYPWHRTEPQWTTIHQMTIGFTVFWQFKKFMTEILEHPYEVVSGLSSSSEGYSSKTTDRIIKNSYTFGVKATVDFSLSQIGLWMDDPANKPANITSDLQEYIYCNAVRYGGEREWKFMLSVYKSSGERDAMTAMACTNQRWLLVRYVENIISTSDYNALSNIKSDLCIPWDVYRSDYDGIVEKLGAASTISLLYRITHGFNTKLRLKELEQFALEKDIASDVTVKNAISKVKENIQWVDSNIPSLKDWLTSSGY